MQGLQPCPRLRAAQQSQQLRAAKSFGSGASDPAKFLADVKLFQRLPQEQMPVLAGACEPVEFKTGDTVITEGQQGNEFFIISPVKR